MPIDGVFIHILIHELNSNILDGKIRKISQVSTTKFILVIRSNSTNHNLNIDVDPKFNGIYLSSKKDESLKNPLMFLNILKKHILNGTIKNITQIKNDRIINIEIANKDELGDFKTFHLIIELMGKHSNATLIDTSNNKVLDSIKHLSPSNNSYRTLLPGQTYKFPPTNDFKLNPFSFSFENFKKCINIVDVQEEMYSKIFEGVSLPLSRFIFKMVNLETLEKKFQKIQDLFNNLETSPILYVENKTFKDFYSFDINLYNEKINFNNLSSMLSEYISRKSIQDSLNSKIINIKKVLNSIIQKNIKKITIFENSLKESTTKETYKLYGDLIAANIYLIKGNEKNIVVQNYFDENFSDITIPLNPKISASQNIEFYYKKYKKLSKTFENSKNNITECENEINYLNSVLNNLEKVETHEDIAEIREELSNSGYLKTIKNKSSNSIVKSEPFHYVSSNGTSIFVGKNNIQNENLTLKTAKKDYIWFHAKNIPGSHVILAHTNPDQKLIELAGKLAAFYSKASSSSNVPIDYTKIKNVKKIPHSKPGMVIYSTNSTVYVNPPNSIDELNIIKKE